MLKQMLECKEKEVATRLFKTLEESRIRSFKNLVGRILTMIDAISTDSTQRKAVKNVAEEILYGHSNIECENLRYHLSCLAEVLGEKCDWFPKTGKILRSNPLTD